jgi:hypothetical protein
MKLIIGIVILGIAIFLFSRQRQTAKPARATAPGMPSLTDASTFHAVTIIPLDNACEAAQALGDSRILSSEAPLLPLAECDVGNCQCRFAHHKDRRRSEDRRDPYRGSLTGGTGSFEQEKRRRPDRRRSGPDERFN